MLRLLILIFAVYFLLRIVSNYLRRIPKSPGRNKFYRTPEPNPETQSGKSPPRLIDEMIPCAQCGTFNPTRLALKKNELYFCNEQCHEAYLKMRKVP